MMVAKIAVEFKVEAVRERLAELEEWLAKAAQQGTAEHEVERYLFGEMLALGGQLLGAFLNLVGPGDLGEEVVLNEGHVAERGTHATLLEEGELYARIYRAQQRIARRETPREVAQ